MTYLSTYVETIVASGSDQYVYWVTSGYWLSQFNVRKPMYKIISISSGIVVATFNKLSFAQEWLQDNNNLEGQPANLYKLVITRKESKK